MIAESEPLALSGIIVTEVLQGLGRDVEHVEHHLGLWDLLEPRGFETYRNAAGLVRLARSRGVALTTVDAFIATLALERGAVLFTLDGDFSHIGRFTGLKIHAIAAGWFFRPQYHRVVRQRVGFLVPRARLGEVCGKEFAVDGKW